MTALLISADVVEDVLDAGSRCIAVFWRCVVGGVPIASLNKVAGRVRVGDLEPKWECHRPVWRGLPTLTSGSARAWVGGRPYDRCSGPRTHALATQSRNLPGQLGRPEAAARAFGSARNFQGLGCFNRAASDSAVAVTAH